MDKASNQDLGAKKTEYVSNAVSNVSLNYIESGNGAILKDVEGNEFIDFACGIGVMNIGHSNPRVVAAIKEQAEKLVHTCFMVNPYASAVTLAEKLCALTPGAFPKKAFSATAVRKPWKTPLRLRAITPSGRLSWYSTMPIMAGPS